MKPCAWKSLLTKNTLRKRRTVSVRDPRW